MCCWFKCEHEYATIPSVNMALTIEPKCEFLCKKVKLLSHDKKFSKIQYLPHNRSKSYKITFQKIYSSKTF